MKEEGRYMRTISIINLKGGSAKTLSSVNIAHILESVYGREVLLIDNDKQGDASKPWNRLRKTMIFASLTMRLT